jgi:diguanylate cyclase (GGDEF)-like protein
MRDHTQAIDKAQKLRLSRVLRGSMSFACTAAIVLACWAWDFLEGVRAVHYLIAVTLINGAAIAMILSGANLRLRDPSMTVPLVIASLWPSLYVMYHVNEPMVRAAFLLMGTVAVLFGALALDRRQMLGLSAATLLTYLLLLAALQRWAPERIDLRLESLIALAYFIVLVQIASLGSFIGGLRHKLRQRNASLESTMAELRDLATRDPLTRLPNRRTAMTQLQRELARCQRRRDGQDDLCIGLLDVDHFKRINDRHGHQAGDTVLRRIGDALSAAMRQGDFVARFGGEEFLIIMPDTAPAGAVAAAERLRQAIETIPGETLGLTEVPTVSIGLAAHRPDRRVEETLACADQALYRAKHLGRNRVALWDDSETETQLVGT